MKKILAVILAVCVIFTGCSSLFSGDTSVVMPKQDPYARFDTEYYEDVVIEDSANIDKFEGEGKDAFYMLSNHGKDDVIYFECLDYIDSSSTFVYAYQTYYYGSNEKGIDQSASGLAPTPTSTPTPTPEPTEPPSPTPTPIDAILSITPTPIDAPIPTVVLKLDDVLNNNKVTVPNISDTYTQEELNAKLANMKLPWSDTIAIENTPVVNPTKMVTVLMMYNFKTTEYKVVYLNISDTTKAQTVNQIDEQTFFCQKVANNRYFIFFGGAGFIYNKDGSLYRTINLAAKYMEVYNALQKKQSITITNVSVVGPLYNIYLSATIETGNGSGVNENTEWDDSMENSDTINTDQYSAFNIQVSYVFTPIETNYLLKTNTNLSAAIQLWQDTDKRLSKSQVLAQKPISWTAYKIERSSPGIYKWSNGKQDFITDLRTNSVIDEMFINLGGNTFLIKGKVKATELYVSSVSRTYKVERYRLVYDEKKKEYIIEKYYVNQTDYENFDNFMVARLDAGTYLMEAHVEYGSVSTYPYYDSDYIIYNGMKSELIKDSTTGSILAGDSILTVGSLRGATNGFLSFTSKAMYFTKINNKYIEGFTTNSDNSFRVDLERLDFGESTGASAYDNELSEGMDEDVSIKANPDILTESNVLSWNTKFIITSVNNGVIIYDPITDIVKQVLKRPLYTAWKYGADSGKYIGIGFEQSDKRYTYYDMPYAKVTYFTLSTSSR